MPAGGFSLELRHETLEFKRLMGILADEHPVLQLWTTRAVALILHKPPVRIQLDVECWPLRVARLTASRIVKKAAADKARFMPVCQ